MSKGSRDRTQDREKYRREFARIFRDKKTKEITLNMPIVSAADMLSLQILPIRLPKMHSTKLVRVTTRPAES